MSHDLTYQVKILQSKNRNVMLTAISGMVAAFFATAILPSLLIQYLYAGKQLLQVPPVIEYIQVGSFVLGFGYFLYAIISNILRAKRVNYLLKKMKMDGNCCEATDHKILEEIKNLSEAIAKGSKKKSTRKKSSAKKSSKKKSKSKK